MYGHNHNSFRPHFSDLPPSYRPANYSTSPPPFALDSTTSDGRCYDSPGYTGSQSDCIDTPINNNGLLFQIVSSPAELFDSDGSSSSVTKGFCAGDLEGANMTQHRRRSESPFSNENDIIIKSMNKACRYSPKEKQERIERYRSKKTQRNFDKKIKYVCRKTLADNRPRIKGRFARNDEIERTNNQGGGEEGFDEENVENWMFNFSDPFSSNLIS
ncbi:zinc finger protein CONSTANS-LIKE 3-like [Cynara cardunculus var. scolymus]|uniref:CCT domain-containing protein n=1 Tax=Cynara cardunculus var. scolymus TaxID=59895 RepID=A0A103XD17_CYNCS|nr:zinc finger protein CONSTANS-LIKE 3-like [Cynara cardunculus var. scolymus]KVH88475.1 CCT domain-containing protein [Cynara cardunculus var. scolymus]